jgi:hypothetical protein
MTLGDDWYAALGRMVAAASELEGNAAYLAVRMTGLSNRVMLHEWRGAWETLLGPGGGVSKTLRQIETGSELLARPDDLALTTEWLVAVHKRLEQRNRHVHSITVVGVTREAFQPPMVGRLHPRTQVLDDPPTVEDLGALARDFARLSSEALTLAALVDADTYARQLEDDSRTV